MLKKEQWPDIAAAAFIALALALTAIFQSIPSSNGTSEWSPPGAEPHQDSTRAARNGQNSGQGVIEKPRLQIEAEREHRDEHEKNDKPWINKFWGDPNAFFAFCVFLATIAQAVIARKQWQAIREANKVAERAAEVAEKTSERQAEEIKTQIGIAKDAAEAAKNSATNRY
jgi:hypothetical protein